MAAGLRRARSPLTERASLCWWPSACKRARRAHVISIARISIPLVEHLEHLLIAFDGAVPG
eukprot:1111531-Prymnesium_polylepis.1